MYLKPAGFGRNVIIFETTLIRVTNLIYVRRILMQNLSQEANEVAETTQVTFAVVHKPRAHLGWTHKF